MNSLGRVAHGRHWGRGSALVALACVGALLAGCGGAEDPSVKSASPSPSASATESAAAVGGMDPVARKVPLAGTEKVRVQWYPKSLDAEGDPVVEAARRFEQLFTLGYYEPGWTSKPQMRRFVAALSMSGAVKARSLRYWNRKDPTQAGTLKVLMSAPERLSAGKARVFSCLDSTDILDVVSDPGPVRQYTLELDGSHWKVSDYEVNFPDTPADFRDLCREGEWQS